MKKKQRMVDCNRIQCRTYIKIILAARVQKTASYILEGLSKTDIRKIAWKENIYQVKAEYRAYEVLNGIYRRVWGIQRDRTSNNRYSKECVLGRGRTFGRE